MSKICPYCKALKFNGETMGMFCASGKVKLPLLAASPEPLKTFLTGTTSESKRFLSKIRKYNSCFQMTSFGTQIENPDQFMSTFKVKGQIYKQGKSVDGQPTIFKDTTIGRLYTVQPNQHECFFLRLLCECTQSDIL